MQSKPELKLDRERIRELTDEDMERIVTGASAGCAAIPIESDPDRPE